jgi:hypothetical protein
MKEEIILSLFWFLMDRSDESWSTIFGLSVVAHGEKFFSNKKKLF